MRHGMPLVLSLASLMSVPRMRALARTVLSAVLRLPVPTCSLTHWIASLTPMLAIAFLRHYPIARGSALAMRGVE